MQFDDFHRLKVLRGRGRKGAGEHGSKGKVRGDEHTHVGFGLQQFAEAFALVVIPTGGANHCMQAVLDGETHVLLGGGGHRQIHNVCCPGIQYGAQFIIASQGRDQFHILGRFDGGDGFRTHASAGTEHGHLDLCTHAFKPIPCPALTRRWVK